MFSKAFDAHGYCEIVCKENIIYIKAHGPWNDEYFEELHQKLIALRAEFDPENYTVYLEVCGEAIPMNSSIDMHKAFLKSSTVKGVALNLEHCTTKIITKEICSKVYDDCDIKHEYFDAKQAAIDWLHSIMNEPKA